MPAIHPPRLLRYGIAVTAAAVLLVHGTAGATRKDAFGHRVPVHHEHEPVAAAGYNDTPASAEPVDRLDPGRDRRQARILGTLAPAPSTPDTDFYAIELRVGDVLGAAVAGAPELLAVHDPAGGRAVSSRGNLANLFYPAASPLPRGVSGKPVLHYVAVRDGRYTLAVTNGTGPYEVSLQVHRPGSEQRPRGTVQTLFLDFDGARVDTTNFAKFGATPGVRDLSPLKAFLPRWGLSPTDEPALVRVITTTVNDIIRRDVAAHGVNRDFAVRIVTSADRGGAEPFGRPDVTRVVIGGSYAEAVMIPTVGVAESIDPGNFAREETALVLLDLLSGDPDDPNAPKGGRVSLNHYLTPASDKIQFIGRVLGQTAAHEAAHLYGSFHTDPASQTPSLMDGGPAQDPADALGVGPDGIGGTADDPRFRLVRDTFDPNEAFSGIEDTLNLTAFALSRGRGSRR